MSDDFNFDIDGWGDNAEEKEKIVKEKTEIPEETEKEKKQKKEKTEKKKLEKEKKLKEKEDRYKKIELKVEQLALMLGKQQTILESISIDEKSVLIPIKVNEINEICNSMGRNVLRLESRHGKEMENYPKSSTTAEIKLFRKFYKELVEKLVNKGYDVVYSDTSSMVVSKK